MIKFCRDSAYLDIYTILKLAFHIFHNIVPYHCMSRIAVIDFETTGLSPAQGARPTEVAIVLVESNAIVGRYQSLMNPGIPIPYFIQQLTGITDAMVRKSPSVSDVMKEAADFVGDAPLLAHNASFDKKFWQAELARVNRKARQDFACSLLLARRIYPTAPNHKLETLVRYLGLPSQAEFHRAMADAECTAHLLVQMKNDIEERFSFSSVDHHILLSIQALDKAELIKKFGKSTS